jgi:Mg2+-importing ATPase
MLPLQILISNLIIDLASMTFPFDRVDLKAIKKPIHRDFNQVIEFAFVLGAVTSILDLCLFFWARNFAPDQIQTLWFVTSGLAELLFIFSIRTHGVFFKSKPKLTMVAIVTIGSIFIFLLGIFGITGTQIGRLNPLLIPAALICPIIYFIATELVKLLSVKFMKI